MNTIVLYKKNHYMEMDGCENMTVLKTEKSLEEVKQILDDKAQDFLKIYKVLKMLVDEVLAKITPKDYEQEETSETIKEFEKYHNQLVEYVRENYILELDNQFLNILDFVTDREKQDEYVMMLLEDWVEQQNKIIQSKPSDSNIN